MNDSMKLIENLICPVCNTEHYDIDHWADHPHRTHLCNYCGILFESPNDIKAVSFPTYTDEYIKDKTMNEPNILLRMDTSMLHSQWNTPKDIIERARAVMGSIDCDPATNLDAQTIVKAKIYYDGSIGRNGLLLPWFTPNAGIKNIWLNPPYGTLTNEFCYRSLILWEKYSIYDCQMIVLVRGDGSGLNELLKHCDKWVRCNRIKFEPTPLLRTKLEYEAKQRGQEWKNSPVPGSIMAYFGNQGEHFSYKFQKLGLIFDKAVKL